MHYFSRRPICWSSVGRDGWKFDWTHPCKHPQCLECRGIFIFGNYIHRLVHLNNLNIHNCQEFEEKNATNFEKCFCRKIEFWMRTDVTFCCTNARLTEGGGGISSRSFFALHFRIMHGKVWKWKCARRQFLYSFSVKTTTSHTFCIPLFYALPPLSRLQGCYSRGEIVYALAGTNKRRDEWSNMGKERQDTCKSELQRKCNVVVLTEN